MEITEHCKRYNKYTVKWTIEVIISCAIADEKYFFKRLVLM